MNTHENIIEGGPESTEFGASTDLTQLIAQATHHLSQIENGDSRDDDEFSDLFDDFMWAENEIIGFHAKTIGDVRLKS